jgi:hypothetical protein
MLLLINETRTVDVHVARVDLEVNLVYFRAGRRQICTLHKSIWEAERDGRSICTQSGKGKGGTLPGRSIWEVWALTWTS